VLSLRLINRWPGENGIRWSATIQCRSVEAARLVEQRLYQLMLELDGMTVISEPVTIPNPSK